MANSELAAVSVLALWDDNPSEVDLLGFDAVVAPILRALDAPDLDPLTVGIHGPWGGGKSTILGLIEGELDGIEDYVVVRTDPWEYDDHSDVRGTLIAEVLAALEERFGADASLRQKTRALLRRVSWSRVSAALAKGVIAMRWDPKELVEAFSPETKQTPESMSGFRAAFGQLLDELPRIRRVVVLVDDLDRCLPQAVMATLEAIKLFLSVGKMVFVIAADQDMVRDAIAASLDSSNRDRFAGRYLEKIVQLPVSLPRLAPHEAEAYIVLLLSRVECGADDHFKMLVDHCRQRRQNHLSPIVGALESLPWRPDEELLLLAGQLAQGLGAERVGNPREIKRFLNAFGVRRQIALARGVDVSPDVIAKLLLLEDRYRDDFDTLAGTPDTERPALLEHWEAWARGEHDGPPRGVREATRAWAAAEPLLADKDLGPYITLAASLAAAPLGETMREELRKLLGDMMSDSQAGRDVAIESAAKLPTSDQQQLVDALLARARRTEEVSRLVEALIGLGEASPALAGAIAAGIREHCWTRLDPAAAFDLSSSGSPPFKALGQELARDQRAEPDVRQAARQALEATS